MSVTVPDTSATAAPARRLRTVYCTRGGLFGALVLERLRACGRIEICAIVRSSRTFHPDLGFLRGAFALTRRSGIAYALYLFLATTVAELLARLPGVSRVPPVSAMTGIPVLTTRNLNGADGLGFLRNQAPDLLVSAFFDQRLQEPALAVPTLGCLNIHPSLLPSFKGVDPVLQARLHGATAIGVSVHQMTPELDAGTVLAQRTVAVRPAASIFEATALLYRSGAEMLAAAIDGLRHGSCGGTASRDAAGSYQSWPTPAEIRALHTRGNVLIRLADLRLTLRTRRAEHAPRRDWLSSRSHRAD